MSEEHNIYKTVRLAAGITQERAAELLNVSVGTLSAYERSRRPIEDDNIVLKMIEIYGGCQHLAYQHLRLSMLAKAHLPEVTRKSLPEAVLSLLKELSDVEEVKHIMIKITCDNDGSDEQHEQWEKVQKELNEACGAIFTVLCAGAERKENKP